MWLEIGGEDFGSVRRGFVVWADRLLSGKISLVGELEETREEWGLPCVCLLVGRSKRSVGGGSVVEGSRETSVAALACWRWKWGGFLGGKYVARVTGLSCQKKVFGCSPRRYGEKDWNRAGRITRKKLGVGARNVKVLFFGESGIRFIPGPTVGKSFFLRSALPWLSFFC